MVVIVLHILTVIVLYGKHFHTPVVCASGGDICFLTLISATFTVLTIFLYIGERSSLICMLQQIIQSLTFTTSLGPILVKSLQLLFCSRSNGSRLSWLLTSGRWIIIFCITLGQLLFCALYIRSSMFLSVKEASDFKSLDVYFICNSEPLVQYYLMFLYSGVLVLLCFICSFMAETPINQYNMPRDITVAMLTLIISWIIYIPTYMSAAITFNGIIDIIFGLGSSFGMLSTMFFPKCYILIFRKELNSSEYFGIHVPSSPASTD
ncbi:vomeronasal type-2 receptor 1-like [Rhinophrynus dorsalis]